MSAVIRFRDGDRRWVQLEAGRVTIGASAIVIDGLGAEKRQEIGHADRDPETGLWHLYLEESAIRAIYRLTISSDRGPRGARVIFDFHQDEPFREVVVNP